MIWERKLAAHLNIDLKKSEPAARAPMPWLWALLAAGLFVAIFVENLLLPLGVAAGIPYAAVVLLGWWFPKKRHVFILAGIATVLTLAGHFYSPEGGVGWMVPANQLLAVFLIWVLAALVVQAKTTMHALKASEARLTEILNIAPEAVIAVGRDMNILLFNTSAERIFGYGAKEIIGEPLDILMPEYLRQTHKKHVQTFDDSKDSYRLMDLRQEITGLHKDGTVFPASASVSKREIAGQKIYTVMLQDITRRKQVENAVVTSRKEADYANYAKSQFLANMNHELRTPLNAIIGFSQILIGRGVDKLNFAQVNDYAANINDSANHLLVLLKDILDVSKIETGELALNKKAIDFEKLIGDCRAMVRPRAINKGVELSCKIAPSLPPIAADDVRLKQILLNLLSNAIKFTPQGGTAEIAVEPHGKDAVLLKISDTGIGIAKEDIPKVLQPFGQAKDVMVREHAGTGLGLYLAKSLTELHGGIFEMTSETGKGTTVTVQLPGGQKQTP